MLRPRLCSVTDNGGADETRGDRPDPTADRWERLGDVDWKLAVAVTAPTTFLMISIVPLNLTGPLTRDLPLVVRIVVLVAAIIVVNVLALAVARLRTPQVFVHTGDRLLRTRRATVRWDELDLADLLATETKRRRTLILLLRSGTSFRAPVVLRRSSERPIDERAQGFAAAIIRGSSIAMPVSRDDPSGRFARFNFPTSISKDEALQLVLDPPAFGEPIPIPPAR